MPVILIEGGHLADTMFTLDARILGYEVSWNVTKLVRDAERGKFGKPWKVPVSEVPPQTDADRANIDWPKVTEIATSNPEALARPIIAIGSEKGGILCFVDGSHRLCARIMLKLADFEVYVVPHRLEKNYRVTIERVA